MRYNRRYSAKPTVRTITVKYDGACACCGAQIKAGQMADYYPVGTIASRNTPAIAHISGLDGNSARCSGEIAKRYHDQTAAYVSAGLGEDVDFCPSDNS